MLTENVTIKVTCSGTRLSRKFTKIKDKTLKGHQQCPASQCSQDYTGKTARSFSESVLDHNGTDSISQLVKQPIEKCHK